MHPGQDERLGEEGGEGRRKFSTDSLWPFAASDGDVELSEYERSMKMQQQQKM